MELIHKQFGTIRIAENGGQYWFCAADICKALGYTNNRKAINDHCREKGVTKRYTLTEKGNQEMLFIDEGNLYRLILKSNMPQAKVFEDWVCDEVLPSLRQMGYYEIPQTNYIPLPPIEPEEPALLYYNNKLCIMARWLFEKNIISRRMYDYLLSKGTIWRIRRSCKGTPALVVWDTLPYKYRQKAHAILASQKSLTNQYK